MDLSSEERYQLKHEALPRAVLARQAAVERGEAPLGDHERPLHLGVPLVQVVLEAADLARLEVHPAVAVDGVDVAVQVLEDLYGTVDPAWAILDFGHDEEAAGNGIKALTDLYTSMTTEGGSPDVDISISEDEVSRLWRLLFRSDAFVRISPI